MIEFRTNKAGNTSLTLFIDGVDSGVFPTVKLAKEYLEKRSKEVIIEDKAIPSSGVATQKIDEVRVKRRYLRKASNDRTRSL